MPSYEITAHCEDRVIALSMQFQDKERGTMNALVDSIVTKVIDTQDKLVRDCLINMGWTPPEGKNALLSDMELVAYASDSLFDNSFEWSTGYISKGHLPAFNTPLYRRKSK